MIQTHDARSERSRVVKIIIRDQDTSHNWWDDRLEQDRAEKEANSWVSHAW